MKQIGKKNLMNSLKNCSRKIPVWLCGQLKRVTFFPVSSCQLHVRKREEKKKKITALQLLCVCVLYYRDQKRHLSCRRAGERATVATVAALFLQFWCYTLYIGILSQKLFCE